MGLAMWIATASFFLGQAQVFPEPLRRIALLVAPVLVVAAIVVYWAVRVAVKGARARAQAATGRRAAARHGGERSDRVSTGPVMTT